MIFKTTSTLFDLILALGLVFSVYGTESISFNNMDVVMRGGDPVSARQDLPPSNFDGPTITSRSSCLLKVPFYCAIDASDSQCTLPFIHFSCMFQWIEEMDGGEFPTFRNGCTVRFPRDGNWATQNGFYTGGWDANQVRVDVDQFFASTSRSDAHHSFVCFFFSPPSFLHLSELAVPGQRQWQGHEVQAPT